ncbi:hypothetical protein FQN49_001893 [Arthroderma sp. PD_2]|nr:hypothetical protein FQN49_001893 [Arthroderma sp. PD_2]
MARRTPFTYEMLEQYQRLGPDPHLSHVYRIDENTAVKFGDSVRMAEAAAMGFVREKTSIPIPEVYDSYVQDGSKYGCIVMEYVNGSRLDEEWESYDKGQKDGIISQLKQYFNELRSTPGTFVGSVDLTHCEDQFFSDDRGSYCPFESEAAFNDGLIRAVRARGSHSWAEMVVRFIKALPRHKIVLTHNDLSPRNILVRNAKVVAIVDWELSGFYPAYWEYVKAYFWPDWESPWVTEGIVDKIIEPFTLELAYMLHVRDII